MSNLTLDRPTVSRTTSVRARRAVPAVVGTYTGTASRTGTYTGTGTTVGAYAGRAPLAAGSYVRSER